MSHKNVEIVRKAYASVSATLEMPRELFTPDFEFDNSFFVEGVVGKGFEIAEGSMRPYWEAFEDFRVEIEDVIYADEERVVDVVRDGGRIRGSGAEVTNRFFHVWTFNRGKIARLSIHGDRNHALEAAGLREEDLKPAE